MDANSFTFRIGKYLGSGGSPTSGRGSSDGCNTVRKPNNRFSGWQSGSSNMDREEGNTNRVSGWQIRSTDIDREIMNANRVSGLQRGNMTTDSVDKNTNQLSGSQRVNTNMDGERVNTNRFSDWIRRNNPGSYRDQTLKERVLAAVR